MSFNYNNEISILIQTSFSIIFLNFLSSLVETVKYYGIHTSYNNIIYIRFKSLDIMKYKLLVSILLIIALFHLVSAITASIGNSVMVLRISPGDEIQKSILTKNVNNVPVTINVSPSGDLGENIIIKDSSFILLPNEERPVLFSIKADGPGRTESKINFIFKPEEGNAVGLAASITVIADEKYSGNTEKEIIENNEITEFDNEENKPIVDKSYEIINEKIFNNIKNALTDLNVLIISGFVLSVILIALFFYFITTKPKNKLKNEIK